MKMFALEKDSEEMNNLYGKPELADTVDRLKAALHGLIAELDDPVDAPALMRRSPSHAAAASDVQINETR